MSLFVITAIANEIHILGEYSPRTQSTFNIFAKWNRYGLKRIICSVKKVNQRSERIKFFIASCMRNKYLVSCASQRIIRLNDVERFDFEPAADGAENAAGLATVLRVETMPMRFSTLYGCPRFNASQIRNFQRIYLVTVRNIWSARVSVRQWRQLGIKRRMFHNSCHVFITYLFFLSERAPNWCITLIMHGFSFNRLS